jgi:hypothetical protein
MHVDLWVMMLSFLMSHLITKITRRWQATRRRLLHAPARALSPPPRPKATAAAEQKCTLRLTNVLFVA